MCSSKTQIHASGCGPKIRFDKCSVPKQPARHQDLRNPKTLWEDVYVARWVPCCWTSCMWCWKRWINWPPPPCPPGGAQNAPPGENVFFCRFSYFISCHVLSCWKPEAGSWKLEAGRQKPQSEARSRKMEAGAWSPKLEARSQKADRKPAAGPEARSQKPE